MGSQISPDNVVGRDELIERIWKRLKHKSVRLTAERRIGKTTVLKRMLANPKHGTLPMFLDLEKVHSPTRFIEVLLGEFKSLLSAKEQARVLFGALLQRFGGAEVAGVIKLPDLKKSTWQEVLERAFEGICSNNAEQQIVIMFDELPYMLQAIHHRDRKAPDNYALAILDTLRAMRHRHDNLRMIFAGSIGLHHVLSDLRGATQASQPVNDMEPIEITSLELADARVLADRLMTREGVDVQGNRDEFTQQIAEQTDRVPFYIERVVNRLSECPKPVSVVELNQVVLEHLTNDHDLWEMNHFRDRLEIYYDDDVAETSGKPIPASRLARSVLDFLATAPESQTIDQIWDATKASFALNDRHDVVRLLQSLAQDHYLVSDAQKRYAFRFGLVKRWWVLAQGLS
jgi:hypothetical protein